MDLYELMSSAHWGHEFRGFYTPAEVKPPFTEESTLTGCRRSLRWTSSRLPCCTASGQEPLELRKRKRISNICERFYSYHILGTRLEFQPRLCDVTQPIWIVFPQLASLLRCFISFKHKNAALRGRKRRLSTFVPLKIAHRATCWWETFRRRPRF